jgi:hypothetical protein
MVKWTAKLWMVANRNNWLFLVCVLIISLWSASLSLSFKKKKKQKQFITKPNYFLFFLISSSSFVQDCIWYFFFFLNFWSFVFLFFIFSLLGNSQTSFVWSTLFRFFFIIVLTLCLERDSFLIDEKSHFFSFKIVFLFSYIPILKCFPFFYVFFLNIFVCFNFISVSVISALERDVGWWRRRTHIVFWAVVFQSGVRIVSRVETVVGWQDDWRQTGERRR